MPKSTSDPIEVVVYAPFTGGGGVRRCVLRMLDTWREIADPSRWRFRVVGQPVDGSGHPIPWPAGVCIPVLGDEITNNLGIRLCDFLQSNQDRFFAQLRKHAATADIIWLAQPWWTMRVVNQVVDLPAHIVPTVHDYAFDELDWGGVIGDRFRAEASAFVQVSSHSVFSSEYVRQAAISRYGMDPDKGSVIYLADFVPDCFSPSDWEAERVRARYDLPKDYWLAFHAIGHKDPLTIVESLAKLKERHPNLFVPLVIAGMNTERMRPDAPSVDPYSDEAKSRLANLRLRHGRDYFILGFIDDEDIGGLYHGARACVSASRSEAGLSATLFEAMKARVPLVYSDISPFTERLGKDGKFGLHFKVGDSGDLCRALAATMEGREAARLRADAAYALTTSRGWPDVGQDYLNIFERLVASGQSTRVWTPPKAPPTAIADADSVAPPSRKRMRPLRWLKRALLPVSWQKERR